jgi:tetratricopeptide (TPR) repeat protein
MEDELLMLLAASNLQHAIDENGGILRQEEAFAQLLLGPSAAARRRRSSFALPIEESTGRPALPTASKLTKGEYFRRSSKKDEVVEQKGDPPLELVANGVKAFKDVDTNIPNRKISGELKSPEEGGEEAVKMLLDAFGDQATGVYKSSLSLQERRGSELNDDMTTSSRRVSAKPVDEEMLAHSRPHRLSLKPEGESFIGTGRRVSMKQQNEDASMVSRSPRVSLKPEDEKKDNRISTIPISSKLDERVGFLKLLTEETKKFENTPSFVKASARNSVINPTDDMLHNINFQNKNGGILPAILIHETINTVDDQSQTVEIPKLKPKMFIISDTKSQMKKGTKKSTTHTILLKKVVIDPGVLQKQMMVEDSEEISQKTTLKRKSGFSKADTGRLNVSISCGAEKHNTDIGNVMMVGKRVDHEIVGLATPAVRERYPRREKTIAELKAENYHQMEQNELIASQSPNQENSPERVIPIELQRQNDVKEEADIGIYTNIKEVDAVVSHFNDILEDRRRKLLEGQADSDIITDTEVPSFLYEIRKVPPNANALESDDFKVTLESSKPIAEPINTPLSISLNESPVSQQNLTPSRPPTAGEAGSNSKTSRSIKSATSQFTSNSGTGNSRSAFSTSGSSGSYSQSNSRPVSSIQSRTRTGSAKTTISLPRTTTLNFSKLFENDPLNKYSLLEFEVKKPAESLLEIRKSEYLNESVIEEKEIIPKSNKIDISGQKIHTSAKKLNESLFEENQVRKRLGGHMIPLLNPNPLLAKDKNTVFGEAADFLIERLTKIHTISSGPTDHLDLPARIISGELLIPNLEPVQGASNLYSIPECHLSNRLEREDTLDLQFQNVVQQYELQKIEKEQKKNGLKKRRSSSIGRETAQLKVLAEKEKAKEESEYETEEETQPNKPLITKGKRLWQVIRKDIQRKMLINSLKGGVEFEQDLITKQRNELKKILEKEEGVLNGNIDTNSDFEAENVHSEPKAYYQTQRREYDMTRYPDLYINKKINPETNQLEISPTKKPTIGVSPELDRVKMYDPDIVYQFHIRHGLEINGFSSTGQCNLYEIVHNNDRRASGLSAIDRVKYPTFEDPGPPVDATGTPLIDSNLTTNAKQPDLLQDLQKLDVMINDSSAPIPTYYRKRGIILSRLEKFNRAMEDFDTAIKYDPFNSDGLWHRHQLYLRYNDAASALADLDALTENNKVHLGAFQAKARIYQALGMYKLALMNYGTVIRLKADNPDAYFNRALLFEVEDEIASANEDYRAVRLLDPTNEVAIHNLAMYSFQKQLWSDCILEYSKLIIFNPENADYYMFRGRAYASMSLFVQALEDLTKAIRLLPDKAINYFHRGCLLREQNMPKAIQDLSVSLLLDDSAQNSDSYFYRGIKY